MREIVLDTETTGLDPYQGHRLIEIGCVEMINRIPTGQVFHHYVNPERDIPAEAFAVHGISADFLKDKPLFHEIAEEFLTFLGDAPLVIHNAAFDLGFINSELERATRPLVDRTRLIDTLLLARRKHPAGPNRLDDLCLRYRIDSSRRTKHGALLDAEILAEVYVELIGARQAQLILVETGDNSGRTPAQVAAQRVRPAPLAPRLTPEERAAHRSFIATLGSGAIWNGYLPIVVAEETTGDAAPAQYPATIAGTAVPEQPLQLAGDGA
jgi:DNA polymerase-3 subunit epsilon